MSRRTAHKLSAKWRSDDVRLDEKSDFSNLFLSKSVLDGLKRAGFRRPSPIQLRAIPIGLYGTDLIIQAKSGTGKTCVFTVIALECLVDVSSLQVLIVAPTREIAAQICTVVNSIGVCIPNLKCFMFIGGTSLIADVENLEDCRIAVGTPGRIRHLMDKGYLKPENIRLFVLDEADNLMDENFLPDINYIQCHLPFTKQTLALSATFNEELSRYLNDFMQSASFISVNADELALKGLKQFYQIIQSHPTSNIVYNKKMEMLWTLFSRVMFAQCLIFCNYITRVKLVCDELNSKGLRSIKMSSQEDQKTRLETIEMLKASQCKVLVTSDLTARGIDAENVDLVINFDVPYSAETYLHRVGRAGRFGSRAVAITLVVTGEEKKLVEFSEKGNFKVYCLPDPVPEDFSTWSTENQPYLRNMPTFHEMYSALSAQKFHDDLVTVPEHLDTHEHLDVPRTVEFPTVLTTIEDENQDGVLDDNNCLYSEEEEPNEESSTIQTFCHPSKVNLVPVVNGSNSDVLTNGKEPFESFEEENELVDSESCDGFDKIDGKLDVETSEAYPQDIEPSIESLVELCKGNDYSCKTELSESFTYETYPDNSYSLTSEFEDWEKFIIDDAKIMENIDAIGMLSAEEIDKLGCPTALSSTLVAEEFVSTEDSYGVDNGNSRIAPKFLLPLYSISSGNRDNLCDETSEDSLELFSQEHTPFKTFKTLDVSLKTCLASAVVKSVQPVASRYKFVTGKDIAQVEKYLKDNKTKFLCEVFREMDFEQTNSTEVPADTNQMEMDVGYYCEVPCSASPGKDNKNDMDSTCDDTNMIDKAIAEEMTNLSSKQINDELYKNSSGLSDDHSSSGSDLEIIGTKRSSNINVSKSHADERDLALSLPNSHKIKRIENRSLQDYYAMHSFSKFNHSTKSQKTKEILDEPSVKIVPSKPEKVEIQKLEKPDGISERSSKFTNSRSRDNASQNNVPVRNKRKTNETINSMRSMSNSSSLSGSCSTRSSLVCNASSVDNFLQNSYDSETCEKSKLSISKVKQIPKSRRNKAYQKSGSELPQLQHIRNAHQDRQEDFENESSFKDNESATGTYVKGGNKSGTHFLCPSAGGQNCSTMPNLGGVLRPECQPMHGVYFCNCYKFDEFVFEKSKAMKRQTKVRVRYCEICGNCWDLSATYCPNARQKELYLHNRLLGYLTKKHYVK